MAARTFLQRLLPRTICFKAAVPTTPFVRTCTVRSFATAASGAGSSGKGDGNDADSNGFKLGVAPCDDASNASSGTPNNRALHQGPDLGHFMSTAATSSGLPCSAASFVPLRSAHSSAGGAEQQKGTSRFEEPPVAHVDTVERYDWTQGEPYKLESTSDAHVKYTSEEFYAWSRLPPTEAYTIPPQAYYHNKFFEIEKAQLFARSWVAVGVVDKVREWGDTFLTSVAGQPLFITRSKDGEVRGFFNVCRHRGAKLLRKDGKYGVISCPYHRWAYAGDGRLLATPYFKGDGRLKSEIPPGADDVFREDAVPSEDVREAYSTEKVKNFNKKDFGLFPVRTEVRHGLVYVNVSGDAVDIDRWLGDVNIQLGDYPLNELTLVREAKYTVNANWKLLGENFVEYMHLPAVHPALCDVSGVTEHMRAQGKGNNITFVTHPISRGGTPVDTGIIPNMPGLGPRNRNTAWFHLVFPNMFHFGFPHSWFVVIMNPVSPKKTVEHAYLLVHPDSLKQPDAKEKIDAMWDFYTMVNDEDIDVCQLVQEGVASAPYAGGRMTFKFEETVWRYQQMVIDHMVGKPRVWGGDKTQEFNWRDPDVEPWTRAD